MAVKDHSGFPNYETRLVVTWLDSDHARKAASINVALAAGSPVSESVFSCSAAGAALKDWVRLYFLCRNPREIPAELLSGLGLDLLSAAVDTVVWTEVARSRWVARPSARPEEPS